MQHDFTPI